MSKSEPVSKKRTVLPENVILAGEPGEKPSPAEIDVFVKLVARIVVRAASEGKKD